jgi:hypothetical protein
MKLTMPVNAILFDTHSLQRQKPLQKLSISPGAQLALELQFRIAAEIVFGPRYMSETVSLYGSWQHGLTSWLDILQGFYSYCCVLSYTWTMLSEIGLIYHKDIFYPCIKYSWVIHYNPFDY